MKKNVMIPRFAFWMVVSCFMVPSLYAQSVIHQGSVGQKVPSNLPPDPSTPVKHCVGVLINEPPSPYIIIVPGWGADEAAAIENAIDNARMCSATGTIYQDPSYDAMCEYVDLPECASRDHVPTAGITAMATPASLLGCRVRAKLVYCDGSIGFQITTSGTNWCEAIQKARKALCRIKDPCKPGYLKYCIETQ